MGPSGGDVLNGDCNTQRVWSLFVQYPNRDPVLREFTAPPSSYGLAALRAKLEVFEDQQLWLDDVASSGQLLPVERSDQLIDGASVRVAVPRRKIHVSLADGGRGSSRQVAWYPGATSEQIEATIAKACGFPAGTAIELLDGDVAVVISASIPSESRLTAVPVSPLAASTNGELASNSASREIEAAAASNGGYGGGYGSTTPAPVQSGAGPASPRRTGGEQGSGSYGPRSTPPPPGGGLPPRAGASRSATATRNASPLGFSGSRSGARMCGGAATVQPLRSEVGRSESAYRLGLGRVAESSARATSPPRSDSVTGAVAGAGSGPVDLAAQPTGRVSSPDEHCVHVLAGHSGFVLSLCTVGDVLFTGSQDCNIMIWDLNNLQYIGTLPGHRGFVKSMVAMLSRKLLCSGSQDKTIKIWSLETFSSTKTLLGHTGEVNALTILEGTDVLVSGSEDRSIRVWDLATYAMLTHLEQAHGGSVFTLAQLDGGLFLSGGRDRTMKVWLASTWQARKTLSPPHYDSVSGIAVGANHARFFSTSRDRSIRRWDARSLESDLTQTHAHGDWLSSVALSPSENVVFSGSKDCVVKVWDPDLHCKDILVGHRGPIAALLSHDKHLFSASHDRTVRVWRVNHYEP